MYFWARALLPWYTFCLFVVVVLVVVVVVVMVVVMMMMVVVWWWWWWWLLFCLRLVHSGQTCDLTTILMSWLMTVTVDEILRLYLSVSCKTEWEWSLITQMYVCTCWHCGKRLSDSRPPYECPWTFLPHSTVRSMLYVVLHGHLFASSLVTRCHRLSSLEICFQSSYTLSPWEFACSLVIRCHLGDLLVVWL